MLARSKSEFIIVSNICKIDLIGIDEPLIFKRNLYDMIVIYSYVSVIYLCQP